MRSTKFTNLCVTGVFKNAGVKASSHKASGTDAAAAAGDAPTKAEFDAAVTLLNELKAKYNGLLDAILG